MSSGKEEMKRQAGWSAAGKVEDGDVVGLGTGSTAAYAIKELGRRVSEDGLEVRGVPTSYQSRSLAIQEGIPVTSLAEARPDVAIDGADQYTPDLALVKGGGAAHSREKVVAEAAERVVIVVDESKHAGTLDAAVPVEVLGFAAEPVVVALEEIGADVSLRMAGGKDGPVVTDNGNLVVDADFGTIEDPETLGGVIAEVPGVVEHGLFVDVADEIHVGSGDGVDVLE